MNTGNKRKQKSAHKARTAGGLKKKGADVKEIKAGIELEIKAIEMIIRQRKSVITQQLSLSELHDLRLQLADLNTLNDLMEMHIEGLKNYRLYLDRRKKPFGF